MQAVLTYELMTNIRLWRVHGLAVMAHVLGRVEVLEGQAVKEITWVQQPCNGAYLQWTAAARMSTSIPKKMHSMCNNDVLVHVSN